MFGFLSPANRFLPQSPEWINVPTMVRMGLNSVSSLFSGALLPGTEGLATSGFHEERTQQLRRRRHGSANLRRRWL